MIDYQDQPQPPSHDTGPLPPITEPRADSYWQVGINSKTKAEILDRPVPENNQDDYVVTRNGFLILDGVGSHEDSRKAVDIAKDALRTVIDPKRMYTSMQQFQEDVKLAAQYAADKIILLPKNSDDLSNAAYSENPPDTTFTILRLAEIDGQKILLSASIGDSPAYVLERDANNELVSKPLTRVDNIGTLLFEPYIRNNGIPELSRVVRLISESFENATSSIQINEYQQSINAELDMIREIYHEQSQKLKFLDSLLGKINTQIYDRAKSEKPTDHRSIDLYAMWSLRNITSTLNPGGKVNISFGSYAIKENTVMIVGFTDGATDNLTRDDINQVPNALRDQLSEQNGAETIAQAYMETAVMIAEVKRTDDFIRPKPDDISVVVCIFPNVSTR